MNALVVYFSKFGNPQMVAEAIARALTPAGSVRALSPDELTVPDLQKERPVNTRKGLPLRARG